MTDLYRALARLLCRMHRLLPAALFLILATGLAGDVFAADEAKVDDAIRRGVEYLIRMQRMDGTWGTYDHAHDLGETALTALALKKSGLDGEHPAIRKAFNYLFCHPPKRTYDISILLMLIEAVDPSLYPDWVERCGTMLVDTQKARLWSYPNGAVDLSNTQYAALGLNAAAACGFRVGHEVWLDLLEGIKDSQNDDGGWGYRKGHDAKGSMVCAGLTCLLVCKKQIDQSRKKKLSPREFDPFFQQGLAWMDRHFKADRNPRPYEEKPGACRWTYYYLYGVERVGTLARHFTFGEHDWYEEGVNWLLPRQGKEGQWSSAYGESEMNTSFAILFLSRATLGARTKGGVQTRNQSKSGGDKKDIVIGCNRKNPGFLWIDSWSDPVAEIFGIDRDKRTIRVDRVEYYAGDTLLGTITEDSTGNRITRFPLEYHFEENGTFDLHARVTCRSKHGTIVETFDSGKISLFVHNNLTETDRALMKDVAENLMSRAGPKVTFSSSWDGKWGGKRALDGNQGTAWLSAKPEKDGAPWIQISFDNPVRANRLKVTHVLASHFDQDRYGCANQVLVRINRGSQKVTAELGIDAAKKYEIPFKTTRVREIRIEMLDRVKGKKYTAAGFSEIELFYEKKK